MKKVTIMLIASMAMTMGKAQNLKTMVNGAPIEMIEVKGGSFTMGDHNKQNQDALPLHKVTLDSYYVGRTEVTQQLWKAVMGYNNSHFKGDLCPVESIEYEEIMTFLNKLNALTGVKFRLLTEAEWEFAARGGLQSKDYVYSGSNDIDAVGWTGNNPTLRTHNVANKAPNELGIYDMTGNVWEWCSDYNGAYTEKAQKNPKGPTTPSWHQAKGGGYSHFAYWCQLCYRDRKYPAEKSEGLGFRLAMDATKGNKGKMEVANEWYLTRTVVEEKDSNAGVAYGSVANTKLSETNIVEHPTREQLVGVWQACTSDGKGGRKYGITFKILSSDGKFQNMGLTNVTGKFGYAGTGTWKLEDGCLVETVDVGSGNIFEGKSNAMELTLSDGGNLMHIIWVHSVSGARVDEYFEKVE